MAFNIVAGVNNAAYGSVTGSGSYEENDQVTLEVTANSGYRFVSWDDSNTDNPRVFTATEDVVLVATLEAIPEYTVTVNINNDNLGSVTGAGTYQENASVTVTAVPVAHCAFSKFIIDNTDITTNPYTFTVTDDVLIGTEFVTLNWYTITVTSDDTDLGSVSGSGDYDEGDTVTLTAVPETDCRFTGWSDGNIENPRTFQASASLNLTAYFEAIDYKTFSLTVNDNTKGSVTGGSANRYEAGTQIELTAVPESGCKFVCWEINGEDIEYNNPLLFDVDEDTTIEAQFADIEYYTVNIFSTDADYGSVTIVSDIPPVNGKYQEESELTVTAVPSLTGKFLSWGDNFSKTPERTVYVNGNIFLRANFCSAEGPLLVSTNTFKKVWTSIKNFFSSSTGASKIGVPANNALGATTLADVVNSVGQANGLAQLNADGKINISDLGGSSSSGLDVDITGNAVTATSAGSADVATKLGTTTVGASDTPIYLNAGTPTACGTSLAVDITGNAATATSAAACTGNAATATSAAACTGNAATATTATTVKGSYTSSGGKQNPNYFGTNKVGFLMMNTTVNSNTQYKDWIIMDCYNGTDVGGGVAFGVNRQSLGAYIMRSAAARTSWDESAELIGTHNYTSYTVKKDGTGASGSWGISVTGSSASCTGNAATATTATNANNAKLTHTVGNTEYPLVFGTSAATNDGNQALRIGCPTTTLANCALRCKAYCAAANTQGESTLIIGNNLATASANNSRGRLILYGTSTGYTILAPGYNSTSSITVTLPSSTGTLALANANTTGSSGSCTGNSASATYATNIRVTDTDSNTWYPIVLSSGSAASTNYVARVDADSILAYPGTAPAAGTQGHCYMQLGNAKATATAANKRGHLRIYGVNTSYSEIVSGVATTARTFTLPDITGLAVVSSDSTVYNISVVTALPSSPNAKTVYLVK